MTLTPKFTLIDTLTPILTLNPTFTLTTCPSGTCYYVAAMSKGHVTYAAHQNAKDHTVTVIFFDRYNQWHDYSQIWSNATQIYTSVVEYAYVKTYKCVVVVENHLCYLKWYKWCNFIDVMVLLSSKLKSEKHL